MGQFFDAEISGIKKTFTLVIAVILCSAGGRAQQVDVAGSVGSEQPIEGEERVYFFRGQPESH